MIDFHKNKLINEVLVKYYETFSLTLDTCDYVPEKFNKKIHKYIFKNMQKKFKQIDKDDRLYCKAKKLKQQQKTPKTTFKSFMQSLFQRKQRSEVVKEKAESEQSERINSDNGLCSALDKETSK